MKKIQIGGHKKSNTLQKISSIYWTLVDDEDFEWLNQWKWSLGSRGYVRRKKKQGNKIRIILMHRLITQAPPDKQVDHINHNKLDNRKDNLRIVTNQENQMNRKIGKNNKSGILGVRRLRKKWQAFIGVNGKTKILGLYKKKEDALEARKKAENKYFKH